MTKKQLLHVILVGILALIPLFALAQSNERMLIYSKSGEVFPYRAEHIDSIKFLTDNVDLTLNPAIAPHENGKTGWMKIKLGKVGASVKSIKVILPESFMIANMNDMQCLRLFTPEKVASMGLQIDNVEDEKEYDLPSMQQGYTYTALFLPYDEYGCPGNVKRVNCNVPKGKLAGNPEIEVAFSDITQTGYTTTLKPNADVAGYFFLSDLTDATARNQKMQKMHIPDLKHYIVQYGADLNTNKPHEGEAKSVMSEFVPGTSYSVFVVLKDKNGQYSDVQKFAVMTKEKGTSETAHVTIKVTDITATEATVVNTPDANTSSYCETIIPQSDYNEKTMIEYLTRSPGAQQRPYRSDEHTQTWPNLKPATEYYALAIAQNADGKWGPLTKVEFTTRSEVTTNELPTLNFDPQVDRQGAITSQDILDHEKALGRTPTELALQGKRFRGFANTALKTIPGVIYDLESGQHLMIVAFSKETVADCPKTKAMLSELGFSSFTQGAHDGTTTLVATKDNDSKVSVLLLDESNAELNTTLQIRLLYKNVSSGNDIEKDHRVITDAQDFPSYTQLETKDHDKIKAFEQTLGLREFNALYSSDTKLQFNTKTEHLSKSNFHYVRYTFGKYTGLYIICRLNCLSNDTELQSAELKQWLANNGFTENYQYDDRYRAISAMNAQGVKCEVFFDTDLKQYILQIAKPS